LWNDQRTGALCDEIARHRQGAFVQITGIDALTGFTAPRSSGCGSTSRRFTTGGPFNLPKDYVRNG
jgi:hypothetical protein